MAQTTNGKQVEPHDSVYTVLLVISAAALLFGIVFLIMRSFELFGSIWPQGVTT